MNVEQSVQLVVDNCKHHLSQHIKINGYAW